MDLFGTRITDFSVNVPINIKKRIRFKRNLQKKKNYRKITWRRNVCSNGFVIHFIIDWLWYLPFLLKFLGTMFTVHVSRAPVKERERIRLKGVKGRIQQFRKRIRCSFPVILFLRHIAHIMFLKRETDLVIFHYKV